ncbi:FecR family protein [Caulobacter segnis]
MTDRMLSDLAGLPPDQAAARLLVEIDEADPVQAARLDAWLDQDSAHREAWLNAQEVLASFDFADEHRPLDLPRRRAKALRGPRSVTPWLAAAACAVAAVGLAVTVAPWKAEQATPAAATQTIDFETTDQQRLFPMPDGSKATLAPGSALDLAYTEGERRARLVRGQAYFDVAHDAARPFVVEAEGRLVTALGTRFDVRSDSQGLRVTLLEGSVRVDVPDASPAQAAVVLRPGQELLIAPGKPEVVRQADTVSAETWREARLVFDDKPLSEVVAQLNRYAVLQLVIDDPRVAALRITGQFRAGDNARFARGLAKLYPVRAMPDGPGRLKLVRAD